jgi:glycosyltransferase involved in cell wall biosynthesis
MFTQKVDLNAPVQGFAHRWIEVLADKLSNLIVITNELGKHQLPKNVTVHSLGKERGYSFLRKFFRLQHLTASVLKSNLDGIFVHQIEHYGLAVMPQLVSRPIPVVQFKAHKGIPWTLSIANKVFDGFVTSSAGGLELPDRRKVVIGQGIDTDLFSPLPQQSNRGENDDQFSIVSVGRISPVKDYETLIDAVGILRGSNRSRNIKVSIVGGPGTPEQTKYLESLKNKVIQESLEDVIEFRSPVPNREVPGIYRSADLFVNLSKTGSLDKAVLEAMACECLILTANWAYKEVLSDSLADDLVIQPEDQHELADAILSIRSWDAKRKRTVEKNLRSIVVNNHNLDRFMERLVKVFELLGKSRSVASIDPGELS